MWEISYSWKSLNFPSSQKFLKHTHPGDQTKGVQPVYILTVFYAPDLFLENAELPTTSTQATGLKECSWFRYRLYSLSQSEAGISISIWGINNTLYHSFCPWAVGFPACITGQMTRGSASEGSVSGRGLGRPPPDRNWQSGQYTSYRNASLFY